jgi:hypothetical protein
MHNPEASDSSDAIQELLECLSAPSLDLARITYLLNTWHASGNIEAVIDILFKEQYIDLLIMLRKANLLIVDRSYIIDKAMDTIRDIEDVAIIRTVARLVELEKIRFDEKQSFIHNLVMNAEPNKLVILIEFDWFKEILYDNYHVFIKLCEKLAVRHKYELHNFLDNAAIVSSPYLNSEINNNIEEFVGFLLAMRDISAWEQYLSDVGALIQGRIIARILTPEGLPILKQLFAFNVNFLNEALGFINFEFLSQERVSYLKRALTEHFAAYFAKAAAGDLNFDSDNAVMEFCIVYDNIRLMWSPEDSNLSQIKFVAKHEAQLLGYLVDTTEFDALIESISKDAVAMRLSPTQVQRSLETVSRSYNKSAFFKIDQLINFFEQIPFEDRPEEPCWDFLHKFKAKGLLDIPAELIRIGDLCEAQNSYGLAIEYYLAACDKVSYSDEIQVKIAKTYEKLAALHPTDLQLAALAKHYYVMAAHAGNYDAAVQIDQVIKSMPELAAVYSCIKCPISLMAIIIPARVLYVEDAKETCFTFEAISLINWFSTSKTHANPLNPKQQILENELLPNHFLKDLVVHLYLGKDLLDFEGFYAPNSKQFLQQPVITMDGYVIDLPAIAHVGIHNAVKNSDMQIYLEDRIVSELFKIAKELHNKKQPAVAALRAKMA